MADQVLPDSVVERAVRAALNAPQGQDVSLALTAMEASTIRQWYASREGASPAAHPRSEAES